MPTNPGSRADREAKLSELHDQLTAAVEALVTSEQWVRALEFAARFRTRSFNNVLLIHAQHATAFEAGLVPHPTPTYVAGFRQWQELGRRVAAGQHGYSILAPLTARVATSEPTRPDSWRPLGRGERPRAGEVVRSKLIGVRRAYVWDISQTDGRPLPEPPTPQLLRGDAPQGLWDGLAALIDNAGFALTTSDDPTLGKANGRTDFLGRTVMIRGDLDAAAQVKTLAHELAHVRMHDTMTEAAALHRGIGEVEAESVALMIGAAHSMDTTGYTIPYVSGWASTVSGKTPIEVVQAVGERVRRAAADILANLPAGQLGTADLPGLSRATSPMPPSIPTATTAPPNRSVEHARPRRLA
ncbi:serine/arginine repetitive matrix protein 2 [Agromyces sp. CFH 90414]|uniref:Serine/arginine repetitive matrix protein 2 n=1 Tax=Agromyces agglutinans TaxID=2662258 RepID=A0A6I2F7N3_9MICO|nr:serine/arginine repetitive matrix protein 2 [Agromyces agglutinans]